MTFALFLAPGHSVAVGTAWPSSRSNYSVKSARCSRANWLSEAERERDSFRVSWQTLLCFQTLGERKFWLCKLTLAATIMDTLPSKHKNNIFCPFTDMVHRMGKVRKTKHKGIEVIWGSFQTAAMFSADSALSHLANFPLALCLFSLTSSNQYIWKPA